MLRTVFGVVTVVLLVAIAVLLYVNYARSDKPAGNDVLAVSNPPPLPVNPTPPAPAPVVTPAPQPPAPTPEVTPPTPAPTPTDTADNQDKAASKRTHVVQTGESLWSISKKFYGRDCSAKIAAANSIKLRDHIRVGQVLVLPELAGKESPAAEEPEQLARRSSSVEDFVPQPPTLNVTKPR